MNNLEIIKTNDLKSSVALKDKNLWSEPFEKLEDANFWINSFTKKAIPYVLARFDIVVDNKEGKQMYRRLYGVFIDMRKFQEESV
jgi:hypothetical protein